MFCPGSPYKSGLDNPGVCPAHGTRGERSLLVSLSRFAQADTVLSEAQADTVSAEGAGLSQRSM